MSEPTVVGLNPWLPWPLARWPWWTRPVRAERLAALRIGVALTLLLDVLGTYWPQVQDFFGRDSLGSPEVFEGMRGPMARWSLLRGIEDPALIRIILLIWVIAAGLLLIGWLPRLCAGIAWILSMSFIGLNYYLHNAGDNVRTILLFYLMLSPCGAVWSWRGWRQQSKGSSRGAVYVPAWPLRLLFVQMILIYFLNGLYKFTGPDWRAGNMLHYVMGNVAWTRFAYPQMALPYLLLQLLTWTTLVWELGFPLLVLLPSTRKLALWMGVGFHLGTGLLLQLGPFPLYMMCFYLPLVPWERSTQRQQVH
jgi:hypothetical protein